MKSKHPSPGMLNDRNAVDEIGYRTAAKILVSEFMPIWVFADEYKQARLTAATAEEIVTKASAWAEQVKERVHREREIREVGRKAAEALLVPEWLRPSDFSDEWKRADLQSTSPDAMVAAATKWAHALITHYTTPPARPPETLQQFGFRIAFPLIFEKTGLPVWEAFARFEEAALQASAREEMEVRARAWAEATIRELSTGA